MPRLLRAILDLFSSVRFGVALLVLLFLYMSIGSAGVLYPVHPNIFHPDAWRYEQIRQRPWLEMTEFEWFHWWPFDLLVGLIAVTLVTTTLRRIPFKPINYGVWMIHAGVLVLIAGSVIYFSTKIEAEAPVVRRAIALEIVDDAGTPVATGRVMAMPGSATLVGTERDGFVVEVASADPEWELRTGADSGKRVYSVTLRVTTPAGDRFMRQLVDGHPEYTEDLVFTKDEAQPLQRAVKARGTAIVEPRLVARLEYASTGYAFLRNDIAKAWALYVRKLGDTTWSMRPIDGLPLYGDWLPGGERDDVIVPPIMTIPSRPLDLPVPAFEPGDPCPDVTFTVDGYLRYTEERRRDRPGGPDAPANPKVRFTLRAAGGAATNYALAALDPEASTAENGLLRMVRANHEEEFTKLLAQPTLRFTIPSLGVDETKPISGLAVGNPDLPFEPIGGAESGYRYRVAMIQDDVFIQGAPMALAFVDLETPNGTYRRWVFDRAEITRDAPAGDDPHADVAVADPSVQVTYLPGAGRSILLFVAGPEPERLRAILASSGKAPREVELTVGGRVDLGTGLTLEVDGFMPRAVAEVLPIVVPEAQRRREALELLSRIRLEAPGGAKAWLPFHPYVFDRAEDRLRHSRHAPTRLRLEDGREVEVMFGRERMKLPAEIVLESFELGTYDGGYTGETGSIRDYVSLLRFREPAGSPTGSWSAPVRLSVNKPVDHSGYSYFQAKWDPEEPPQRPGEPGVKGRNYTVLGVGNRHGVLVQLAGVIIAAIGMIYAFYWKPVLKRRRAAEVRASLEAGGVDAHRARGAHGAQGGRRGAASTSGAAILMAAIAGASSLAPGSAEAAPPGAPTSSPTNPSTTSPTTSPATVAPISTADASEPASGPRPFAEAVDLTPLGSVAVQTEGRLKSFGSHANSVMFSITGPRSIAGQSAPFTYLDMVCRPDAYVDADVIYVKNREVRGRIAQEWRKAASEAASKGRAPAGIRLDEVDARMQAFEKSGLISERYLLEPESHQWRRELAPLIHDLEADVIRSAKQIDQVEHALAMRDPRRLLLGLRVLPPGAGNTDEPWHSIAEIQLLPGPDGFDAARAQRLGAEPHEPIPGLDPGLQGRIAAEWRALIEQWNKADAAKVNASIVALADLLPQTDPLVYPDTSRLWWESWYFRNGNLAKIWLVYLGAVVFLLLGLAYRWNTARSIGIGVFVVALLLQTGALGLRWWISGRWPNSNMFEAVTTSAWFGGAAALLLEIIGRRGAMRGFFALVASVACMVALMAVALLPTQLNPNISNVMPVLHDVWLYIHTNVIIFSYCLIFMAAVSAILYVLHRAIGGAPSFARVGGAGEMMALAASGAMIAPDDAGDAPASAARPRARLGEVLDGVTMLLMEVSFVMLWCGIAMGAIWADESWGRPWGWDPKEVFALNTFVIFAILVHVRFVSKDKGLWTAVLAVIGAAVMLFNWIVINFVITGLHSYA